MNVYNKNTYSRVFSYARGHEVLFILGVLISGMLGAIYPVFSIYLASVLQLMLVKPKDFLEQSDTNSLAFLILGIIGFFLSIVQDIIFTFIGEKITHRIRS